MQSFIFAKILSEILTFAYFLWVDFVWIANIAIIFEKQ